MVAIAEPCAFVVVRIMAGSWVVAGATMPWLLVELMMDSKDAVAGTADKPVETVACTLPFVMLRTFGVVAAGFEAMAMLFVGFTELRAAIGGVGEGDATTGLSCAVIGSAVPRPVATEGTALAVAGLFA